MNVPDVTVYKYAGHRFIIVSDTRRPDAAGCYWRLYDIDARLLCYGYSLGWDGDGAGAALSAPKLAKAAARRLVRKWNRASARRLGCAE